jgi:hypothetical protein
MTVVLNFDGKQLPREMRSLPSGRYILQSVDEILALTAQAAKDVEVAVAFWRERRIGFSIGDAMASWR